MVRTPAKVGKIYAILLLKTISSNGKSYFIMD